MSIELEKGQKIFLDKEAPFAKNIRIGLGWDAQQYGNQNIDLDASAFLIGQDGKVSQSSNFVFYGNKISFCGAVKHLGDNLTGGQGQRNDDESIVVSLDQVPASVSKILFVVTIYKAHDRKQNFGQVSNAYIRCVDADNSKEIARFKLTEQGGTNTCLAFGELVRSGTTWEFKAIGTLLDQDLGSFARNLGLNT